MSPTTLTPGTQIGPFEILSSLGEGGMGAVYRARDTKLSREVAIKVLLPAVANDADRLARFQREAQVLASLNHPHIAAIYGLEDADGTKALVLELVEGPTLADRIAQRAIPLDEALPIAKQIAEALEAAHEQGIIHRDLKPANIKVRDDGTVKVLDFGLAKAMDPPGSLVSNATMSPTLTTPAMMTGVGVILGTAAYMSPEQAKGRPVDQRADVWAFGAVLYEMLTGRRSFEGDTVTETLASVLAREPNMTWLPAGMNPRIHDFLRRCLEKDPKRRWQAIGDARVEIDALLADPHGLTIAPTRVARVPLWKFAVPAVATGLAAAVITAAVVRRAAPAQPMAVTRFSYLLPKDQGFTRTGRHVVAISPDGTNIVYVANGQLYVKSMAEMDAKPIPGTALDADTPFFSPDGKWVGFYAFSDGTLKKIAITGGATVALADLDNPFGASWAVDDQIFVGQGPKGIVRVPTIGGKAESVVTVKAGELAQSPQLLPDGDHVLFTLAHGTGNDLWDKAQIVVQSLKTGQRSVIVDGGSDARYSASGHIVYVVGATAFGLPFSVSTMKAAGTPAPVLDGISRASALNTAATFFAFSESGALAFVPGDVNVDASPVTLALVNRRGEKKMLGLPPQPYATPRVSPDGRQLVVEVNDGKSADIWVYEMAGATALRRLTFSGKNRTPIWTRDGQRIVFASDRKGSFSLFWQRADGTGAAEPLLATEPGVDASPEAWSPDSHTLTYAATTSDGSDSIRMLPFDNASGDRKSRVLVESSKKSFAGESAFSPDGRWFVYQASSASGIQVNVRPFPQTGSTYQVSTGFGSDPLWMPDGKQLVYIESPNAGRSRMVTVDVRTQGGFAVGTPTPLLIEGVVQRGNGRPYDVTPDGKQFLVMLRPLESTSSDRPQINVVLNWFQDLKQRAPVTEK